MEKQNKLGKMALKGSVSHRKFQSLWNCLVSKSHALWEEIHLLIYYKCNYEPDLMALLLIPAHEMLRSRNAPCLSPDWATQWLLGQSGLHYESLCTEGRWRYKQRCSLQSLASKQEPLGACCLNNYFVQFKCPPNIFKVACPPFHKHR